MRTTSHRVRRTFTIAARYIVLVLTILGCLGVAWSAYAAAAPAASGDAGVQVVQSATATHTPITPTATTQATATATTQATATATAQATATATAQATATPTGTTQPTPTDTAQPTATRAPRSGAATGGHVEVVLDVTTSASTTSSTGGASLSFTGAWGVIQWQDGEGAWHNVDGWTGTVSADGPGWWVAPKDFGTGPFRWCVYDGPNGALLGVSEPFYLPSRAGETLSIVIGPAPTPAA